MRVPVRARAPCAAEPRSPDLLLLPPSHFPKGVSLSSPSLTRLLISEAQMFLKPVSCPPSRSALDPWRPRHDNALTAADRQPARGKAPRANALRRLLCSSCAKFRALAFPGQNTGRNANDRSSLGGDTESGALRVPDGTHQGTERLQFVRLLVFASISISLNAQPCG